MMRPFLIWILSTLLVFSVLSGTYHFYLISNPRKVLVAVDTSYPMKAVWGMVPQTLVSITKQRYTEFALVTEKNKIHSWSPNLQPLKTLPYAPRDFSKLEGGEYTETDEATTIYFVTNAPSTEIEKIKGWTILHISP